MATVVLVPGLYDSGPNHWQSLWHAEHPEYRRVVQDDWQNAQRDAWIAGLARSLIGVAEPVVFAAHSLGCLTVVHAARQTRYPIQGALLVAPVDLETLMGSNDLSGFTPIPREQLPFPTIVVASTNDFFLSSERAAEFATAWGSHLVMLGACAHINAEAGFGSWPEGKTLLQQLGA
jgi:uncharacterized protein